jgi:hypothetical protein
MVSFLMQGYAGSMLRVKIVSQIIVWMVPMYVSQSGNAWVRILVFEWENGHKVTLKKVYVDG